MVCKEILLIFVLQITIVNKFTLLGKPFPSRKEGQFLARLHARTPILHASHCCGRVSLWEKLGRIFFLEGSLFQAVAQVNPTAQNTFLLLTALCIFLASSFINFSSSLL